VLDIVLLFWIKPELHGIVLKLGIVAASYSVEAEYHTMA